MGSPRADFFKQYPVPLLQPLGRAGGAVALALAALAGIGGAELFPQFSPGNGTDTWSPAGVALSLGALLISPFLAVQGLSLLALGGRRPPRLSDAELLERIRSGERPLCVCLDCRTVGVVPPCDHCRQSSSCLDLGSREDVDNAIALLGLEPSSVVTADQAARS